MRIRILSDLHLEFGSFDLESVPADVVVLAGDIHIGLRGLAWAERQGFGVPVVYVPGNHEYYGSALPRLTEKLRRAGRSAGIAVLDNEEVEVGGVRLIGLTLWTDYGLSGNAPASMAAAQMAMTDFRKIRVSPSYSRVRPVDLASRHSRSVKWLEKQIQAGATNGAVIITHHAPSARSLDKRTAEDPLAGAYASNLDELVDRSGARVWIHGHTHRNVDYEIGSTRVVSNQRGYPDDPAGGFREGCCVEV